MSTTEKIEIRRDAVARAPYALLAVIDAAITLGQHTDAKTVELPALEEIQKTFADKQTVAIESLAVVCKEAESFRAMSERPQTIVEALNAVHGAQKAYALSVDDYLIRLEAWRLADAQTGRIRVSVCERIQREKGLAATPADKLASGDPEYTSHKDSVANLSDGKDCSEYEMKVAESNLKVALATLDALTCLTAAQGVQQ